MALPNQLENITNRNNLITFVTAADIKTYCNLYANTEESQLKPVIFLCQDVYLRPSLGTTLYTRLMEEWVSANYNPNNLPDGTTLPDGINYKQLYQEIKLMLIWWSYYRFLANVAIKVSEKGITIEESDFSENQGIVGLKELEQRAKVNAQHYQDILVCYIKDTFKKNETINNEKKQLFGGMFMGMYIPTLHGNCNNDCDCNH